MDHVSVIVDDLPAAIVFFTTLGHPDDFKLPQFRKLLTNGVLWALDKPIPPNK